MKKVVVILSALLAAALLSSCSNEKTAPEGMKKASGEAAAYTFYIPEEWNIDLQTGATTAHFSAEDTSNISVMAWELESPDQTIDDWWEVNLADLETAFTDFKEESSETTTLDGAAAKKYIYTATLGSIEKKYMQTAAVNKGAVYVITYSASADVYDEHLNDVASMLEHFSFG